MNSVLPTRAALLPLALSALAAAPGLAQDEDGPDLVALQQAQVEAGDLKVLGEPVRSHDNMLTSIQIHPDGARCVSAGWDGALKIWNLRKDGEPLTLSLPGVMYFGAWCGEKTDRVVGSTTLGQLQIWDATTGEVLETLDAGDAEPRKGTVSPDGRTLVVAYEDGDHLDVFDVSNGLRKLGELPCEGSTPGSYAWSPDGSKLVVGGILPGKLWIFDVAGQKELASVEPSTMPTALAIRSDGAALAIGGYDALEIWSFPELGDEPTEELSGFECTLNGLHFVGDDEILMADSDGAILRLDYADEEPEVAWQSNEHRGSVVGISVVDGVVASASRDTTVRFWSLADGEELLRRNGNRDRVQALAFSADGSSVLSGDYGNVAAIYSTASGALRASHLIHQSSVLAAGEANDELVSVADDDSFLRIDPKTGSVRATGGLAGEELPWMLCGTVRGGKLFGGWEDGVLRVHSLTDGSLAAEIEVTDEVPLIDLAVSESAERIATVDYDGVVTLHDGAGAVLAKLLQVEEDGNAYLAFVGDDAVVVGDSTGKVRCFAAEDGAPRFEVQLLGEDELMQGIAATAAGGGRVAVASYETIRILDAASGKVLGESSDFVSLPASLAFSPDGETLATGMSDATTLLWKVASLLD